MTTIKLTKECIFDSRNSRDVASMLGLAASPTFALMAWISANDMQAMICSDSVGILPVGGMTFMYLLMGLFHLSPWLKLASAVTRQRTQPPHPSKGN